MEPLTQSIVIPVQDPSQVSVVRRAAGDLSRTIGLDEQRISAVNIVAVELANNLLQHAVHGEIYLQHLRQTGVLDIAAVDHGVGMANVDICLTDGFSTGSTPGLGLGAVRRFAKRFDAYSVPGRSTVVAARMAETNPFPNFSVVSTAIHGETFSGDGWDVSEDGSTFLVVDGLGHGLLASDAAKAAIAVFRTSQNLSLIATLDRMHAGLRATRGAAVAIARVDSGTRTIHFAGVGNINCMLQSGNTTRSFVSHNGTVGHQMRRTQEFQIPYQAGDSLLMHSDGLTTHSKGGIPATLMQHSPALIAPFLYSEQRRGRDDATILVVRLG
jgi:anti-sigma regulatory factor (Ser/Thr protein kinase)